MSKLSDFQSLELRSCADTVKDRIAAARRYLTEAWEDACEAEMSSARRVAKLSACAGEMAYAMEALRVARVSISEALESKQSVDERGKKA